MADSSTSRIARATALWALIVLNVFNTLSSFAGGIGFLATGDLGMPHSLLDGSPFTSFTIPAIILLVIVGGTQAVASVLLIARRESGLLWSAIAGFGMVIWIFVETVILRGGSFLQALYFATGTLQLVCVVALLGIASWLPRVPLEH